jgi:hypothetical protein
LFLPGERESSLAVISLRHPHPVVFIRLVGRCLHCTRPQVLCPRMQRFLRLIQVGLHLMQLQLGMDAFALSLLLLAGRFLCLSAWFEELRAQTFDELEGVIEQSSPVVERTKYNRYSKQYWKQYSKKYSIHYFER